MQGAEVYQGDGELIPSNELAIRIVERSLSGGRRTDSQPKKASQKILREVYQGDGELIPSKYLWDASATGSLSGGRRTDSQLTAQGYLRE